MPEVLACLLFRLKVIELVACRIPSGQTIILEVGIRCMLQSGMQCEGIIEAVVFRAIKSGLGNVNLAQEASWLRTATFVELAPYM